MSDLQHIAVVAYYLGLPSRMAFPVMSPSKKGNVACVVYMNQCNFFSTIELDNISSHDQKPSISQAVYIFLVASSGAHIYIYNVYNTMLTAHFIF